MIIQQVLLAVVIFLGFQLVCGPQGAKDKQPSRTAQQILGDLNDPASGAPPKPPAGQIVDPNLGTMAWADAELRVQTIATLNTQYQNQIDEDEKQKKITPEEAKIKRMQGVILVADTQYKKGRDVNDTNLIRTAFLTLSGWQRKHQSEAFWNSQSYEVPHTLLNPGRFPYTSLNPDKFYHQMREELSARNKVELVYGIFPGYDIIDGLVALTGRIPGFSYAFAAFLLAFIVRLIIYPVAQRQLMWGRKMQQLSPLLKEIKLQYTDKNDPKKVDQAAFQAKTMELYREYGINPAAGCLPAFIQFPLFITVYQFMLHYQFEFQKGYFLWINPASSKASNSFFAPNLGSIDYTLLIIYGVSMLSSTLLMPVSDPTQIKQQKIMGVGMSLMVTAFMFGGGIAGSVPVPAAFVLYWTFTNILATIQSLRAYRLPAPPLEKVNTSAGGVYPKGPFGAAMKQMTEKGKRDGSNGKSNGSANGTFTMPKSTGTPAKHKPKKRK